MTSLDKVDNEIFRLQELIHAKELQHGSIEHKPLRYFTDGARLKVVRSYEIFSRFERGEETASDRDEMRDLAAYPLLLLARTQA